MKKIILAMLLFSVFAITHTYAQKAKNTHTFEIKNGHFLYDGNPVMLHSGEMHFARIPHQYWRHRLKMLKAMGLNAVATYVFWNWQETAPGVWNFTGDHDLANFVKTAGEEGLFVILRPGPYACAEWEFGGYPWWLQKTKGLVIRADNKPFLDSCKVYINKFAAQIKDLQITKGGPVIMVQAENEFGSYVSQRPDIPLAVHKSYSLKIKNMLLDAGIEVPLFTSDGSWVFEGGTIAGALPTANGEKNTQTLKDTVNKYHHGEGPYMVAEYYPGWLDHWAEPFQKVSTDAVTQDIRKYLEDTVSFNMYMAHGGTNFGFTSGANYDKKHDIQPDITSYDYDAPINEAGWNTPKYDALKALLQQFTKAQLPQTPARIPVIKIPDIHITKSIGLFQIASKMPTLKNQTPLTFEELNQGYGYVLYSKLFNDSIAGTLHIPGLRDFATVYINGKKIGLLNRNRNKYDLPVQIPAHATLQILVENMGRINYGAKITENTKGIISPVYINEKEITNSWSMTLLPFEKVPDIQNMASMKKNENSQPIIYQATFKLKKTGDTFLDMSGWGKGIVFINGKNLGRYWSCVGPQQTLYVPGVWLKKGTNEVVIFEQLNDEPQSSIKTTTTPILDQQAGN